MRRSWFVALAVAGLVLAFVTGLLFGRVFTPLARSDRSASSTSISSGSTSSGSKSTSSSSSRQQERPPCDCYGPDLDCDDFATWEEAQRCYTYCLQVRGYDVFRLDADGDGIACERLRR